MDENRTLETLHDIFFEYQKFKTERMESEGRSFVHYTSADAARSIIENREIWLRNSSVMNDYSELAHGEECVRFCLANNDDLVKRSRAVLDSVSAGLHDRTLEWFNESSWQRRLFTYILSISEHGPTHKIVAGTVDEESFYGRLSMWRAYGSQGGVALIFKRDPVTRAVGGLNAYSSPVFYGEPRVFAGLYNQMLDNIERRIDEIHRIDPAVFEANLQNALHFATLSTKHPGFAEEREWRVTYSAVPGNESIDDDEFNASSTIKREFRSINGIPQRIYKIPFRDDPKKGVVGVNLPDILQTVLIGPTQYPVVVHDALAIAMLRAGFARENVRIKASNIPIRT